MVPASEAVEALLARAKESATALRRLKGAEVTRVELKVELASIGKEWLKTSQGVRNAAIVDGAMLGRFDTMMQELVSSASTRARATALLKKIEPFVDAAFADVVVPLIQYEGSPRQVAGRQVQSAFTGQVTPEEATYIEEAARCITVQCHRAALMMLWAAGIARLHAAVMNKGFKAFNAAVDAAVARKSPPFHRIKDSAKISSLAELQRSKDADLLIVGMELFGYDLQIYQELDRLLGIRNDFRYPAVCVESQCVSLREGPDLKR
jgi:hypothetical protein